VLSVQKVLSGFDRAGGLRLWGNIFTTALLYDQRRTNPFGLIVRAQGDYNGVTTPIKKRRLLTPLVVVRVAYLRG